MRIGNLNISLAKKEPVREPPQSETSYVQSLLYSTFDFMPYDPDDLKVAKGADVYKKVLRDEQVKAAARFRRNSVTGRKWLFMFDNDVELSDDEKVRRIKVMEQAVKTMPGSFKRCLDGIMSAMFFGFSLTEKTYQPFEYDGRTYWGIKSLRTKPHETFLFHSEPTGELERIEQRIDGTEVKLNITRFVHHVYNSDVHEHYGQSELRECYRPYWSKDVVIKLQNIYLERMAGGFVWTAPSPEGNNPAPGSKEETAMRAVLSNIQTKTGIMMPKDIDLHVEHPSSTDAFERAIIQYNLAIAKGLLMPNLIGLSEQGPNGSRALGDTQLEAFLWMLDAETADLEETLNEQLFRELGDFNFADGIYPEFKFKPLSQSMIKIIATLWGDLVSKGAVTKTDTDEAYLRDMLGFPDQEEDEDASAGPETSLNGAQVTSVVEIARGVASGELPKSTGVQILVVAFPITREAAEKLLGDIEEGTLNPGDVGSALGGPSGEDEVPDPSEEEEEDETVVGQGELTIEYNAFSRAQQRVDFTRIDSSANVSQWQNVERLSELFGDLTGNVAEFIRDNPDITTDPAKLKEVKVPASFKSDLKKTVRRVLKDGWDIGVKNAEQEIARASGKRMSKKFNAKFAGVGGMAAKYFAAKEFTITGKLLADYESVVQNAILTGIKYSKSTDDIIADITRQLGKKGMVSPEYVDDLLGEALETNNPRARLETVVRTNMFDAVNESRFSYFTDSELGGFVRSMEYSAILDSRTTEICSSLDNTVLPVGSSEWDRLRPPNHFNAVAEGELITTHRGQVPIEHVAVGDKVLTHAGRMRRVYAVMGKQHDSVMREIKFSSGDVLHVTDEHPVLTRNGWKRADQLSAGEQCFHRREQRGEMPVAAGVSSEVSQAVLLNAHNSPATLNEPFVAYSIHSRAPGMTSAIQLNSAPVVASAWRIARAHMKACAIALTSDTNTMAFAGPGEGSFPNTEVPFYSPDGHKLPDVHVRDNLLDSGPIFEVNHENSDVWVASTIISNDEIEYTGNAYNLAVEGDESYVAGNVVVHNCRSLLVAVTERDDIEDTGVPGSVASGEVTPGEGFS